MILITSVQAQIAKPLGIVAGDTVITSSSLDTVSKVIQVSAGYSTLSIQVVGTRNSGAVTSKAYLYVSNDGVDYDLTDSTAAFANSGRSSRYFTKVAPPWTFYKVQVRPPSLAPSTESLSVVVWPALRKYNN